MSMIVPAYYYAQQGADYSRPCPGESFDGWAKTQVPLDFERTAVVVMHAWRLPSKEDCPGLYEHLEYADRADAIVEKRFPSFLRTVRAAGVRIIHVGAGFEPQLQEFPGYHAVRQKYPPQRISKLPLSESQQALKDRHWRLTGATPQQRFDDIEHSFTTRTFAIKPLEHEEVVTASNQLFSLCCEHGIEHLIYTGFAVNACLVMSACGLLDMSRHDVMCSVVGDLTTAVENKKSCREQYHREYGLWQFAIQSGFVFISDDLKTALTELNP